MLTRHPERRDRPSPALVGGPRTYLDIFESGIGSAMSVKDLEDSWRKAKTQKKATTLAILGRGPTANS
jgi:hypothetical protein